MLHPAGTRASVSFMNSTIREDVYAETTKMDIHDLVRELNDKVGPTIVQTMAGTKDRTSPSRWAKPNGPTPNIDVQRRLRLGYRAWLTVARSEGDSVALAWLVGSNPRLNDELPLQYVVDERVKELLGAAEAFVGDTHAA